MTLTQDQKVMIYAAALQATIPHYLETNQYPVSIAISTADDMIAELEQKEQTDTSHQID